MVKNSQGQVAIKFVLNPNQKSVRIDGESTYYTFVPRNHVVLSWVNPEHVDRLLRVRVKKCNCNNGTFINSFQLANLIDVNVWTYNSRHGESSADYSEVQDVLSTNS